MIETVLKRNGDTASYDNSRIARAVRRAADDVSAEITDGQIDTIISTVQDYYNDRTQVTVEELQDAVEDALEFRGFHSVAKGYIRYRQSHADMRSAREKLAETYHQIFFGDAKDSDLRRDNANINTDAPMGMMLKLGAEGSKAFCDSYVIPEEFAKADKENFIHIHDKDFSLITFNCCQIDLLKLFHGGFSTGHGFLREPNSIRSAASLACIAIQSNQNDMFGGQSINALDYALAPYVDKSYRKHLAHAVTGYVMIRDNLSKDASKLYEKGVLGTLTAQDMEYGHSITEEQIQLLKGFLDDDADDLVCRLIRAAEQDTEEETKQAMEAMIHNFNTLHSRAGAQVPFCSINYGLDTTPAGRLVIRKTLDAVMAGLGNGETSIFPISVFVLKAGVNYNPEDPNYDLFQYACEVSARRLFPNFENLDATYNLQYYRKDDYNSYVATMGCRTRVMSNVNGPEESGSRGNFAFTTINLPALALEARRQSPDDVMAKFWELFDHYIQLSKDYLEFRYEIIARKHAYNFPFLMGQGVWRDSGKLEPADEIRSVLKHASISIGFCGLAECLKALTGYHHGESEDAQELGLKIVGHLREMTDKFTDETHMNWSTFATPAESTAGQFARSNRKRYGLIEGVTDREYLTNSSHVPVYYPTSFRHKVDVEAPYHELENAGHIAYIEMDGDPGKNVKAFETVVRYMHDKNMGYFSINHPVDRDPVCGYTGLIENECPHCHRKEKETGHMRVQRL